MNGPIDAALRRKQLEQFAGLLAEKRRRAAKLEHQTRGYRDDDGIWRCGLLSFMRYFWHILEPGRKMTEGWVLEAICEHLEAVAFGEVTRLLITVPPGCSKSLLTDVYFPAWLWAIGKSELRFMAFSYSVSLTERDNGRFRDLMMHPEFQALYKNEFTLRKVGETKITNTKHGWKIASSIGGLGTGERADFLIVDDPHNVKESESDTVRDETVRWFREVLSDRMNDMGKGAIIVIMQRVHQQDVAGVILDKEFDYCHLSIAMEFMWDADDNGEPYATDIGWTDPRWQPDPQDCDGELMWPERFPESVVEGLKKEKGPHAYAAQYLQTPEARGGGIIKREYWQSWEGKFPAFSYIFASLDGAFTKDEQNDPSGLTVWGVFEDDSGHNRAMLIFAWEKRLEFEGQRLRPEEGENQRDFMTRQMEEWGLVEWTAHTLNYWKCDRLVIEGKASGLSVAQALQKRYRNRNWAVQVEDVKGDKVARTIAVQATFSNKMVYAPIAKDWCQSVINQMAIFPFGTHDDLHDSATQALKHLRDLGLLEFDDDIRAEELRNARLPEKDDKLKNYLPGT